MISSVSNLITAKSIWISDVHLGSCGTQETLLFDFLDNISCENLFLNGDIIDKWLLKNNGEFNNGLEIFKLRLRTIQNSGTSIVFFPGNHDDLDVLHSFFSEFKCLDELCYVTKKGKRYLIFHGDKLDYSVHYRNKTLSWLGTYIYEFILKINKKKCKSRNFSKRLKLFIKNIFYFVFRYKKYLFNYLVANNYDGVICGHSHQPKISKLNSKDYFNSGDWVDNCTFLLETLEGEFQLLRWELSSL
jgi:UDP-2,3-diacylglucosamine pyrophosphatase LpxH